MVNIFAQDGQVKTTNKSSTYPFFPLFTKKRKRLTFFLSMKLNLATNLIGIRL